MKYIHADKTTIRTMPLEDLRNDLDKLEYAILNAHYKTRSIMEQEIKTIQAELRRRKNPLLIRDVFYETAGL